MFYRNKGKVILLVNESDSINRFQAYRKTYHNQSELTAAIAENKILESAVAYSKKLKILTKTTLEMVVEWAND